MIFSRLLVSVLMLGFVFLSACSDDSVAVSTSAGTMTATVNGTAYNGNFAAAASYKNGTLTVLGKDNSWIEYQVSQGSHRLTARVELKTPAFRLSVAGGESLSWPVS